MRKIPLLDLGNVVVRVDFSPFFSWLAKRAGHEDPSKIAPLLRSSLFYDFEFGHVSPSEFARRLGALYGAELQPSEVEEKFCAIFPGLVDGAEEAIKEMAAAGPIYCLTNTNKLHLDFIRREFPVMDRFTKIFASHEMHRRKPYPGIYIDVAEAISCRPEELIFFDDVHANVQGALKAGLEAHVFEDIRSLRERLKETEKSDDQA